MRKTLLMAAAAAALMATPALAQDIPATEPATQPPTDPIGTAPTADVPDATDAVEQTMPDVTATTEADAAAQAEVVDAGATDDIVDVMRADGQFTTLLAALDAAGLTGTLESDDSISILAPTDAAFSALPAGELDRLMLAENREELQELLLYHVINADVRADQITDRRGPVVTGGGAQVLLDGVGGLRADGATITNAELRGSNGGVLVVDQVLSPSTSLAAQGDEDVDAAASTEAEAEAGVEADTTGVEAGVEAEADVTAAEAPVDPAATAEEPTGEEMPATPPVAPEEEPTEPADETDPTTPQS